MAWFSLKHFRERASDNGEWKIRERMRRREKDGKDLRERETEIKRYSTKKRGREILLKIAILKEGETERDEEREIYGERKT